MDASSNFQAYDEVGFQSIGDAQPKDISIPKPDMKGGKWWKYLSNVAKLSPVPKDLKFGDVPQGVLRLGGTFVVDGDEVLYAWADELPGKHPEVKDVLRAAGIV